MGKKGRLIPCENLGEEYKKVEFLKTDLTQLNKWLLKTVLKKRKFGVKRDTSCSKKVGETTITPTLQRSLVSRKKKQLAAVKFFFICCQSILLNPRCMMIKISKQMLLPQAFQFWEYFFSNSMENCHFYWDFYLKNWILDFLAKNYLHTMNIFGKKNWLTFKLFSLSYLDLIF